MKAKIERSQRIKQNQALQLSGSIAEDKWASRLAVELFADATYSALITGTVLLEQLEVKCPAQRFNGS